MAQREQLLQAAAVVQALEALDFRLSPCPGHCNITILGVPSALTFQQQLKGSRYDEGRLGCSEAIVSKSKSRACERLKTESARSIRSPQPARLAHPR